MSKIGAVGKQFIDSIQMYVKGGAGGHGLPKYGGIGGKGGDVYLKAEKFSSLRHFLYSYPHRKVTAADGESSRKFRIVGLKGEDKIVNVPVGVLVYDESLNKIGELNEIGDQIRVAEGGQGGSRDTEPKFTGLKGQQRMITLDLKLIADVGLVGFPNAGKSTLLKAISRAKPRIAAYPFTTLRPNLGVLEYPDLRQITMADLPGLIEGASENVGMGHNFLKHIERTSTILMVVDIDGFQYRSDLPHRSCFETIVLLNKELELYDKTLVGKPAILAVNKMDVENSAEKFKELQEYLKNYKSYVKNNVPEEYRPEKALKFLRIVPISARYDKKSVDGLKDVIREVLDYCYFRSIKGELIKKEKKLVADMQRLSTEVSSQYL